MAEPWAAHILVNPDIPKVVLPSCRLGGVTSCSSLPGAGGSGDAALSGRELERPGPMGLVGQPVTEAQLGPGAPHS